MRLLATLVRLATLVVPLAVAACGDDSTSGADDGAPDDAGAEADVETGADGDAEADVDADVDAEADADGDADVDSDTEPDVPAEADAEAEADAAEDSAPPDPCDPNPCDPALHLTCEAGTGACLCAAGFFDCDADLVTNGCESDLLDPANCGACGVVCTGDACEAGTCRDVGGVATCGTISRCGCDRAVCATPDECDCPDTDGDGLADAWETSDSGDASDPPHTPYIDNNCDGDWDPGEALLVGADPSVPDIFVYYDWMDWSVPGNECTIDTDCTGLGSGHAGETCEGDLCVYACTVDDDCTTRGNGHLTEQCLFSAEVGMDVCQHTHDPEIVAPGSMQAVVDAFALRGYNLHIIRGAAKPHSLVTSFRTDDDMTEICEGASSDEIGPGLYAVSLYTLKGEVEPVFPPAAAAVLHYTAFVHYAACDSLEHCLWCPMSLNPDGSPKAGTLPGMTGVAEMNGNDFIVSLGGRLQDVNLTAWNPVTGFSSVSTVFMHELGHNLGIHHGGGVDTPCDTDADCPGAAEGSCIATAVGNLCLMSDEANYKVAYFSLMNYRNVFVGIQYSATVGDPTPTSARLDFSTQMLPTGGNTPGALDESNTGGHLGMDETAGIGSGNTDIVKFFTKLACDFPGEGAPGIAASDGPVDFDGDGMTTTTNVGTELHYNGQGHLCGEEIRYDVGSVDWPTTWSGPDSVRFTYEFQCTPYYGDGPPPMEAVEFEPSITELLEMHLAEPIIPARIDVRPGCSNNAIDLWSGGEVEVVAFGSFALDVWRVKTDEILFAGAAPVSLDYEDVDQDGALDLRARFATSQLRLGPTSVMATFNAIYDTEQLVFGADRIFVTTGEPACEPCAGWSGGPKREGCWYVGEAGASCTEVCAARGGIDTVRWAHEGNPVCKIFFPEKANGANAAPIECCSTDTNTDFGANGAAPDPQFSSPVCRLACACRR
jgi:hypothetical protein